MNKSPPQSPAAGETSPAADVPSQAWKAGKREWLIITCLCIINACVALDATVVVPPLPSIAKAIGADAVEAFWIGTSYLIPLAVSQLFINGLSESFGRLLLLLGAITCFTVGSVVAGLAHHIPQMLVGRVIQGVGGGGISCLTAVIITDIVPMKERPKFIALPQLTWAFGTIVGPLIGGALSGSTWRWVFLLNLPFCGIGLVMAPLVIKIDRKGEKLPIGRALAKVDWIGAAVFVTGLTSFLVGLSWGGQNYAWNSHQTLLPLIMGAVATVVALIWEARFATHPFVKLSIYNSYSSGALLITAFLQGFMLYLSLYVWNLYFQGVKARSPLGVGVAILPVMCSVMPASITTGILMGRLKYKILLVIGWSMILLGNGLVLLWDLTTPTATWAVTQVVAGLAQGIVLISTFVALQSQVTTEHHSHAAAMYTFMRGLGLSFGVGIGGTIFQNSLRHWLGEAHLPLEIALNIEAYVRELNTLPRSDYVTTVRVAIAAAHKNVFEVCIAFAALSLLLAVGIKQVDMAPESQPEELSETTLRSDGSETKDKPQESVVPRAKLSEEIATV